MKSIVLMVSLFSAATAMACPNLGGKYTCVNPAIPNVTTNVEVSQINQDGIVSYRVASPNETSTYIADKKPYTESVAGEQTTTTSSCVQGKLLVSIDAINPGANTNRKAIIHLEPTTVGFHIFSNVTQTGSHEYSQDNEHNCFR